MIASILQIIASPKAVPSAAWSTLIIVLGILVTPVTSHAGEPLYPACLMNWMVEGSFDALIVDKSSQKLTVWRIKDGEPSPVETIRCSTGENEGDKWVKGDMKTPEGVYFFCSVIDGKTLPPKYGLWGFTTDYPNFVDRRRGKSGDGIWLHGRDKPLAANPDSNGCVALANDDLVRVSKHIRLQSTPLIILDKVKMAPRSAIIEQERQLRDFIEGWRRTWESRDVDKYMAKYSRNFQCGWLDYDAWKEKKRKLAKKYTKVRVKLGTVYLYRQNGIVSSIFTQEYSSDQYKSSGIKVLYLVHDSSYHIYAEDYHKPVDDPYPVAALLARVGVDPGVGFHEHKELSIRLVSTDAPEQAPLDEVETPKPAAPSRAVVLDRLAVQQHVSEPTIEINERSTTQTLDRLLVARVMPAHLEVPTVPILEGATRRTPQGEDFAVEAATEVVDKTPGPMQAEESKPGDASQSKTSSSKTATHVQERKSSLEEAAAEARTLADSVKQREQVLEFLVQWKDAWEQKNLDRFVKMYHPNFGGGNMNYDNFVKSKKRFFRKYRTIRLKVERVQIMKLGDKFVVKFLQSFQGDNYSDQGWKRMVLAGDKTAGLQILREEWSPL
jgi:murein L,D-transpeptidase YafK